MRRALPHRPVVFRRTAIDGWGAARQGEGEQKRHARHLEKIAIGRRDLLAEDPPMNIGTSFAFVWVCFLCGMAIDQLIKLHVKRNHPAIWRKFDYPPARPFLSLRSRDEEGETLALKRLRAFLQSPEREALADEKLDRLIRASRLVSGIRLLAFLVFLGFFVWHFKSGLK